MKISRMEDDPSVATVFERADRLMYENKKIERGEAAVKNFFGFFGLDLRISFVFPGILMLEAGSASPLLFRARRC